METWKFMKWNMDWWHGRSPSVQSPHELITSILTAKPQLDQLYPISLHLGVMEEHWTPCRLFMQARKNSYLWLNLLFLIHPNKTLSVHQRKNSSCPRFRCYYEFTASVCWAGVMIMHRTTRWYTKLVLTTGLLVDSLPPDHHIYHTTHITQNSAPSSPPVRVGGRGRWSDGSLSDSWKMCAAKKFIKHCRFPWHIHLLASPCGTPL